MKGDTLAPDQRVLLEEACRIADRLDELDDFLDGRQDAWMRFHSRNEDGSVVTVVIDKALSEARQQAVALKQLLSDLKSAAGKQSPSGKVAGVVNLADFGATRSVKASG